MSLVRTRHAALLLAMAGVAVAAIWPTMYMGGLFFRTFHVAWAAFFPWAVYAALVYAGARFYERTWKTREASIRADEHGLYLDGRLAVTRRAIRHANLMLEGSRVFVRLHRRAPFAAPVDIEVADEAEARRLLAELRFDAQTSVSEFELHWGTNVGAMRRSVLKFLAVAVSLFVGPGFTLAYAGEKASLAVLGAVIAIGLYFLTSSHADVSVGADGLHLKRIYRRARFVPYAVLRDVRLAGPDLLLDLADGETITLHRDEEGPALEQRIREALSLHRTRNVNAAAVVNRGGRSTTEWLRDTKERTATYREAAVPDDELWSIVEDAAASPTERAGAALALRTALDHDGRNRLRIAAGACAEKKLRVALESVAENASDDALEEVLEPLEDRGARKKLSRS